MNFRSEWTARIISGAVLIIVAVAAITGGGYFFLMLIGGCGVVAVREWHRLVSDGHPARETAITGVAVLAAMLLVQRHADPWWPAACLVTGILLAGASASARHARTLWHALAGIYFGLGAISVIAVRADEIRGGWMIAGIFLAVWGADIGAFFCGRAIGGPKLAPGVSPNKTWAGLIGGVIAAAVAEAAYVAFLGGDILLATLFGIIVALAGHSGDLFESSVKRRFHAKNSGDVIPGHGGMLDRIDSLLFAAPVAASLIFFAGFDTLFWSSP